MSTPTVGRIVHYTNRRGDAATVSTAGYCAAMITNVRDCGAVDLCLFMPPDGNGYPVRPVSDVCPGPGDGTDYAPGCWTWPPRTP